METENQHKLREAKEKVLLDFIIEAKKLGGQNIGDWSLARYLANRI